MPDGPFVSMSRVGSGLPKSLRHLAYFMDPGPPRPMVKCDRCGGYYTEGDWPFCKGNRSDHSRE